MPPALLALAPVLTGDTILLHAFARRGRPLSAGDLLRAMAGSGTHVSEVMQLLTDGVAEGLIARRGHRRDAEGAPAGPLLYELTEAGWSAVEADRS
jgi:hypothetical protein